MRLGWGGEKGTRSGFQASKDNIPCPKTNAVGRYMASVIEVLLLVRDGRQRVVLLRTTTAKYSYFDFGSAVTNSNFQASIAGDREKVISSSILLRLTGEHALVLPSKLHTKSYEVQNIFKNSST